MGSRYSLFIEQMSVCFIDTVSAYRLNLVVFNGTAPGLAIPSLSIVESKDVFILV